jgi:hypothetical protein
MLLIFFAADPILEALVEEAIEKNLNGYVVVALSAVLLALWYTRAPKAS